MNHAFASLPGGGGLCARGGERESSLLQASHDRRLHYVCAYVLVSTPYEPLSLLCKVSPFLIISSLCLLSE